MEMNALQTAGLQPPSLSLSLLQSEDANCLNWLEISRIVRRRAYSYSLWVHMTTGTPSSFHHLVDTFTPSLNFPVQFHSLIWKIKGACYKWINSPLKGLASISERRLFQELLTICQITPSPLQFTIPFKTKQGLASEAHATTTKKLYECKEIFLTLNYSYALILLGLQMRRPPSTSPSEDHHHGCCKTPFYL